MSRFAPLLILATCTSDPPSNRVARARAELGIDATPPRQAWFPEQDYPVEAWWGTIVARGDSFTAYRPAIRNPGPSGFFSTTLYADGGLAPVRFSTPNDFESSHQLTVTPVDDSRALLASSSGNDVVLGLVDDRGLIGNTVRVGASIPFRVVSHRGAMQLAASVYNDAGIASLTAIDIEDGGISVRPTRFFGVASAPQDFAISGDSLAVALIGGFGSSPQVSLFELPTLAHRTNVPVSATPSITLVPEQGGFRVVWLNSSTLLQRRLNEQGLWTEPSASSFSTGATANSLGRWARDSDGGLIMTWAAGSTAFAGSLGGPHFSLGSIPLGELACGPVVCVMISKSAVRFRPRGPPEIQTLPLFRVTPDVWAVSFGWSRRFWAISQEYALGGLAERKRVFRVDLDGAFSPGGMELPELELIDVVGTENDSAAILERLNPGLGLRVLTERDGGLVLSASHPVANGVDGLLYAHDHHFLVTWGNLYYAVIDATGVVLSSGSLPRLSTNESVATPPGEFWVTYSFDFGTQFEALRVSLLDGGTTVETIPGRAMVTTPDSIFFESSMGFVRRFHDGGWTAPFTPFRGGPALWTGNEVQVYPGPSRIRPPQVADSTLAVVPPHGSSPRTVTDRQGNVLLTWSEWVTDAVDGHMRSVPMSQVLRTAIRRQGESCQLPSDCTTSFCADGVCCDASCGGSDPRDCAACSVDAGAQVNGVCGPARATVVCRPARDLCDAPEHCDSSSLACPTDRLVDAGTLCRAAQWQCDLDARCDGQAESCPFPAADAGTVCDDGYECTTNDACSGYWGPNECRSSFRTGPCDDLAPCSMGDFCDRGVCQPGAWCVPAVCQVAVACVESGCIFAAEADGVECDGGRCSAGVCLAIDAGMGRDGGGTDAGLDGGLEADGGPVDAGLDAGSTVGDAGSVTDAGPDAGGAGDSGVGEADGSVADAGGADSPEPKGCGCTTTSAIPLVAILFVTGACARRRRRNEHLERIQERSMR